MLIFAESGLLEEHHALLESFISDVRQASRSTAATAELSELLMRALTSAADSDWRIFAQRLAALLPAETLTVTTEAARRRLHSFLAENPDLV